MKNNLGNIDTPSLEEIRLFQQGKLDAPRAAKIRAEADQNPFLAEAMEGFAANPAYTSVPSVEVFAGISSNLVAAGAMTAKTTVGFWSMKTLVIAATVTVSSATTVIIVKSVDNNEAQKEVAAVVPSTHVDEDSNSIDNSPTGQQQSITTGEPDAAVVQYSDIQDNVSPAVSSPTREILIPRPEASLTTISTDNKNIPALNTGQKKEPVEIDGPKGFAAVDIQHILRYKVADYTSMRSQEWSSFNSELNNVQAPFESIEQQDAAELQDKPHTIPYMKYLGECISAIDNDQYDLAVSKFSVILSQYPDDVNAQFYSGFCLFHLGRFNEAIVMCDKAIANQIFTFKEEAEFYKARSLKGLGRTAEANVILAAIVARGRFYAPQAAKEME